MPPATRRRALPNLCDILGGGGASDDDSDDLAGLEARYDALSFSPTATVPEENAPAMQLPGVATDVPFLLPRAAPVVPDVAPLLAVMPRATLVQLLRDRPRAFLTEPAAVTDARLSLTLFEQHTRHLVGTDASLDAWCAMLRRWAGDAVTEQRPGDYDSPPLTRGWTRDGRTYTLLVHAPQDSFYVVGVVEDGALYLGAFYMQSEQSHQLDLDAAYSDQWALVPTAATGSLGGALPP